MSDLTKMGAEELERRHWRCLADDIIDYTRLRSETLRRLKDAEKYQRMRAKAEEEAKCTPESTMGKCPPTGTAGRHYAAQVILAAAEKEGQ